MTYNLLNLLRGAQDWIRTSTPFPALRPEHSASTNFATWAFRAVLRGKDNLFTEIGKTSLDEKKFVIFHLLNTFDIKYMNDAL